MLHCDDSHVTLLYLKFEAASELWSFVSVQLFYAAAIGCHPLAPHQLHIHLPRVDFLLAVRDDSSVAVLPFVRRWFHVWRFSGHCLFFVPPSFGASGKLYLGDCGLSWVSSHILFYNPFLFKYSSYFAFLQEILCLPRLAIMYNTYHSAHKQSAVLCSRQILLSVLPICHFRKLDSFLPSHACGNHHYIWNCN